METSTCPPLLTERDQTIADLHQAAALIRERGLCQHSYRDRLTGTLDLTGAIYEAVHPGFWTADHVHLTDEHMTRASRAMNALGRYLRVAANPRTGSPGGPLIAWNDDPERTTEEAAQALDAAAAA